MPDELVDTRYYHPTGRGHEKEVLQYLADKKYKRKTGIKTVESCKND